MLFLNISSDKVHLYDGKKELFLERSGIEQVLGPILVSWHQEFPFSQVFVLNGPGGFTNLRVGVLALNLLNTLLGGTLQIFSCTKMELYTYLVDVGFLPPTGLVYLGQKKNIWLCDFAREDKKVEQLVLQGLLVTEMCFVDFLSDASYRGDYADNMVYFSLEGSSLQVSWQGKVRLISIDDLTIVAAPYIQAAYLVEATVS